MPAALPNRAGIGLKAEHVADLLRDAPALGFVEVHAENYMGEGGAPHRRLEAVRARYPLSIHGIGLSIGGAGPLDRSHLGRLRRLLDRYAPESFSEHLAWSRHDGVFLNDLLPVPYTAETLDRVCRHVDEVQEALGRRMLLENPATYVAFAQSDIPEVEFLAAIARRTGCGLLLDVNNAFVSAVNHAFDPLAYLAAFPVEHVGEIHLAGFAEDADAEGRRVLIDAHNAPVAATVWRLYETVVARTGPLPTLIEWDEDVPPLATLLEEARRAERILSAPPILEPA